MKRTLLLTTLSAALLCSNYAEAQIPVVNKILPKVILGVKLGSNFQQMTGNTWDNAYKAGFMGGAFLGVTKKKIGVQVEGLIRSASFDTKASLNSQSVSLKTLNLDVPVLFEYKLVSRLWLQVGPQFTSLLSAKQNNNDVKKSFNTSDFAGVAGLQVILPMHFIVGARYILGLTDIHNESTTTVKDSWNNRGIQLYLGFRFL